MTPCRVSPENPAKSIDTFGCSKARSTCGRRAIARAVRSRTNTPLPCRDTISPSSRSRRMACWTVILATPYRLASSLPDGSFSPGASFRVRIAARSAFATC